MSVAILGQLKDLHSYLGATGDLVGMIKVQCNVVTQADQMSQLQKMISPDKGVYVVFMTEDEFRESIEKPG
jgi:hypothetical protein